MLRGHGIVGVDAPDDEALDCGLAAVTRPGEDILHPADMDADRPVELLVRELRVISAHDKPAGGSGISEQRLHLRPQDRDLAHPEGAVEDRAGKVR